MTIPPSIPLPNGTHYLLYAPDHIGFFDAAGPSLGILREVVTSPTAPTPIDSSSPPRENA